MFKHLFALVLFFTSSIGFAANPIIVMDTNMGEITLELYPEKAPKTVANFLSYIESGFFNGTIFHRVIPDFMIQGGGFNQELLKAETRPPIENEAFNGLKNTRGSIAMARTSNPHSATAQFFINSKNNAFLNHTDKSPSGWGYTVFGNVIKGMDVADLIANSKTKATGMFRDLPEKTIIINSITLKTANIKSEDKKL
jgi:peptidyl-prolyl cis-trans isomerase A (cyclophilin A)/peptidyl-prolyl cis-trans isomerase B (cyclophilin B)